jgi:hypothetical protein
LKYYPHWAEFAGADAVFAGAASQYSGPKIFPLRLFTTPLNRPFASFLSLSSKFRNLLIAFPQKSATNEGWISSTGTVLS